MSTLLVSCRDPQKAERYYLPALRQAGWTGEVRFSTPSAPVRDLEGVAGLLLCGGADIHPSRWDPEEPVHPAAEVDAERDEAEIPLILDAYGKGLPILGICRGEQVLNVALGGSMIQDVPSETGCAPGRHGGGTPDEADLRHPVAVAPGSKLAELLGSTEVWVNSRHHQAVKRIAPPLKAVAFHPETPTGSGPLVEGVEAADPARFVVGVQWHPENLVSLDHPAGQAARNLFRGFVRALTPQEQHP